MYLPLLIVVCHPLQGSRGAGKDRRSPCRARLGRSIGWLGIGAVAVSHERRRRESNSRKSGKGFCFFGARNCCENVESDFHDSAVHTYDAEGFVGSWIGCDDEYVVISIFTIPDSSRMEECLIYPSRPFYSTSSAFMFVALLCSVNKSC